VIERRCAGSLETSVVVMSAVYDSLPFRLGVEPFLLVVISREKLVEYRWLTRIMTTNAASGASILCRAGYVSTTC